MYSLYRAWLMRDAVAAASLASPPDVVITVGNPEVDVQREGRSYGYQFVAHKHLVSLHSGYLKSLIQSESAHGGGSVANVSLPSISPDAFAPLLSFMYTGFLDLTADNIYSVLLATHLLHMPRALDLCRAYLVQNQSELHRNPERTPFAFHNNPSIIKPIPSRKVHSAAFPHPFWPPVNVPPLFLHASGPFQSVSPGGDTQEPAPADGDPEPKSPLAIPSTSKTEVLSPEPSSSSSPPSPCPTNTSFTSDERTVHVIKSPQRKSGKRGKEGGGKGGKKINNENLKVVLDVACCDGPVRFHRVLNECYGMSLDELMDDGDSDKGEAANRSKISDKEYLDNYPKTQFLNLKSNKKFSNFMHQQMLNSNMFKKSKSAKGVIQLRKIVEKEILTQDKSPQQDENETEGETEDEQGGRIYTCVYCKHTFKSQYCYQKHAKRHINPVEDGGGGGGGGGGSSKNLVIVRKVVSTTKVDGKDGGCGNVRREVRLLDMNVQYYPCKTCGSKFPSYYFVHKHRKLCHSGEDNLDENSNHQPEDCDMASHV